MDESKQHVIDTLKEANNILVTVRTSPSIDQLAACIALTLVLNELGKHGTAVYSGQTPSAIDFLEPQKTIERNTDSLQDFIISLDKAKADKLRYKIEDTVVKIFITPYRTSLSSADLTFEPGDFNVDVVVALGVHNQDDVDDAITAHGKILHDATVLSINTQGGPSEELGSIAWIDEKASSLSEMITEIAGQLGKEDVLDNQIATALLTGIVAETERFGNNKTTPETMEVAAKLLTAGANQELVAARLSEPVKPEPVAQLDESVDHGEPILADMPSFEDASQISVNDPNAGNPLQVPEPSAADPGTLEIEHPVAPLAALDEASKPSDESQSVASQEPAARQEQPEDVTHLLTQPEASPQASSEEQAALDFLKDRKVDSHPRAFLEPLPEQKIEQIHSGGELPDHEQASDGDLGLAGRPTLGGTLTANLPNERDAAALGRDAGRKVAEAPILTHDKPNAGLIAPLISAEDQQKAADMHAPTLAELESQVHAHTAEENPAAASSQDPASLIAPLVNDAPVQTVEMPMPKPVTATPDQAPTPPAEALSRRQPVATTSSPPPPVPPPVPSHA